MTVVSQTIILDDQEIDLAILYEVYTKLCGGKGIERQSEALGGVIQGRNTYAKMIRSFIYEVSNDLFVGLDEYSNGSGYRIEFSYMFGNKWSLEFDYFISKFKTIKEFYIEFPQEQTKKWPDYDKYRDWTKDQGKILSLKNARFTGDVEEMTNDLFWLRMKMT